MAKKQTINVEGTEVSLKQFHEEDYFSLNDMAGGGDLEAASFTTGSRPSVPWSFRENGSTFTTLILII